jgi:hypothetical protein
MGASGHNGNIKRAAHDMTDARDCHGGVRLLRADRAMGLWVDSAKAETALSSS